MKNTSIQISRIAAITGLALGAFALAAIAQTGSTWNNPSHTPPTCNTGEPGCDAPINVGGTIATPQYKAGALGIGALTGMPPGTAFEVFGTGLFTGIVTGNLNVSAGSPAAGNLLISDASGNASWVSPSAALTTEIKTCTQSTGGVNYGNVSCTAYCSAGKHVVGGGCSGASTFPVLQSSPTDDRSGWICLTQGNRGGFPATGEADGTAICQ